MSMTSEIKELQDEVREGYVPEKNEAPDYGEPWKYSHTEPAIESRWCDVLTGVDYSIDEEKIRRAVVCVNACAGMVDPAAEIQAMRKAIKDHLDAWMDGPEGWTESCQKLQSFIKP